MTETPWVLVVEDDAQLRQLVALSVNELSGAESRAAANGAEALELLRQYGQPELVVTDLMMPEVDGYQLLDRARSQHPNLPVVAMSAVDSRQEALRAGFNAYLVKPFDLDELAAVLDRWCLTEAIGNRQ